MTIPSKSDAFVLHRNGHATKEQEAQDDLTNHNDHTTRNHNIRQKAEKASQQNGFVKKRGKQSANGHTNGYIHSDKDLKLKKEAIEEAEKERKRLLKLEEMPLHLQFNKYVHTGYREVQGAYGCIKSLFYFHNETVNIITHSKYPLTTD
jgi:hypothetical protein